LCIVVACLVAMLSQLGMKCVKGRSLFAGDRLS
jgi:hypothetical protein